MYSLDKRSNEYLLYLPADLGLFVVLQARAGRCRSEQKYSAVIDLKYSVRYSLQERAQATRFFVSMSAVVLSMISAILSDLANSDLLSSLCVTQNLSDHLILNLLYSSDCVVPCEVTKHK